MHTLEENLKTIFSYDFSEEGLGACNLIMIKILIGRQACGKDIQSTLVISKSKGPSKTLQDIRTSTYQICSIEEKIFEQPNFTNDYVI